MSAEGTEVLELEKLKRENRYLRDRNAQLQGDVIELAAESQRLRDQLERLQGRRALHRPNPVSGGQ